MSVGTAPSKPSTIYRMEELEEISQKPLPRHVAVIPDGNRRWAMKCQKDPTMGHREGADTLLEIVKGARDLGIEVISFYTFSTENWRRSREEVDALMLLLESYLIEKCNEMVANDVRFETIGDLSRLAPHIQKVIAQTKEATSVCRGITMVLALNYGSRDELTRATRAIARQVMQGELPCDEISEELIASHLDTATFGDPDLLIRTSGEMRVSNFLLWQLSYTEIVTTPVLWPDFSPHHLMSAIQEYQSRDRRMGVI